MGRECERHSFLGSVDALSPLKTIDGRVEMDLYMEYVFLNKIVVLNIIRLTCLNKMCSLFL